MAKKVRRVKKKQKKQTTSENEEVFTQAVVDVVSSAGQKLTSKEQFQVEYAYVVKDLRRVFVLAAFMFTLLIVINLLLQ